MKKIFLFAFLFASAGLGFTSCNNGDYAANPNGNVGGINPFNPPGGIDRTFNWSGTDPMSAEINGVAWHADQGMIFDIGVDPDFWYISGQNNNGDTSNITFRMKKDMREGQIYYIDYGNIDNSASYSGHVSDPNNDYNSTASSPGQVKILEVDATHIKGLFFFIGKSPFTGQFIYVGKGYFNINKP